MVIDSSSLVVVELTQLYVRSMYESRVLAFHHTNKAFLFARMRFCLTYVHSYRVCCGVA
jgi:hypothetical protein